MVFPQVSTGLTYAEIGPHVLPVTITPPTSESSVCYTSLLHSKNQSKENILIPAGNVMWMISVLTVLKLKALVPTP